MALITNKLNEVLVFGEEPTRITSNDGSVKITKNPQGEIYDLSIEESLEDYATKEELEEKQDKLIQGDGIKIEDNTISLDKDSIIVEVAHDDTLVGNGTEEQPLGVNTENIPTVDDVDSKIGELKGELEQKISDVDGKVDTIEGELEGKQDTLISGENIKTINGESILGGGDIEIVSSISVGDTLVGDGKDTPLNVNTDLIPTIESVDDKIEEVKTELEGELGNYWPIDDEIQRTDWQTSGHNCLADQLTVYARDNNNNESFKVSITPSVVKVSDEKLSDVKEDHITDEVYLNPQSLFGIHRVDTGLSTYHFFNVTTDDVSISGVNGGHSLVNKQDKLSSGYNIKTINGESILGGGNLEIVTDVPLKEVTSESYIIIEETDTNINIKLNLATNEEVEALFV